MKENCDFKRTINDTDYTSIVEGTFNTLRSKYGYTLRMSMLLQVMKEVFLNNIIDEFILIDLRSSNNGLIESYLIDRYIDWNKGKEMNFSEIYRKIKETYQFSGKEKLLLEEGKIEEKLWALFLALGRSEL